MDRGISSIGRDIDCTFNSKITMAEEIDPPKKRKSLLPDIRKQLAYIKEYTASPKYQERLTKMANTEKVLQPSVVPEPVNAEVFAGAKTNTPTVTMVGNVVAENQRNLNALEQPGKIQVIDESLGRNVAGGYDSSYRDVRLNEELTRANPTVPVHEFSHAANNGRQPYSTAFDQKYLDKVFIPPTNSMFSGEVQKPTEVKARLDAIRFLGKEKGIYDAGKSDFTIKDLDKMLQDKDIREDYNFKQIMDQLPAGRKKVGLLWLMNNIAKNDEKSQNKDLV